MYGQCLGPGLSGGAAHPLSGSLSSCLPGITERPAAVFPCVLFLSLSPYLHLLVSSGLQLLYLFIYFVSLFVSISPALSLSLSGSLWLYFLFQRELTL